MSEKAKELIKDHYTFDDLVNILRLLRSPDGCPWDRAQTHESIRKNLIEECYEAVEGIDQKDTHLLCEELGDLLLQIIFHAQMSDEQGEFNMDDVINGVCQKMVQRHPHVFGDIRADSPESALGRWEEMKKREKQDDTPIKAMNRVARTLPSLMRTQKLIKKAAKAGLEDKGTPTSTEDLIARYLALCADANASGIDLEEAAYAANEAYIIEKEKVYNREDR